MKFTRKDVSVLLEGLAPNRDLVAHYSSYFAGSLFVFTSGVWYDQYSPGRRLCEDGAGQPYAEDSWSCW